MPLHTGEKEMRMKWSMSSQNRKLYGMEDILLARDISNYKGDVCNVFVNKLLKYNRLEGIFPQINCFRICPFVYLCHC